MWYKYGGKLKARAGLALYVLPHLADHLPLSSKVTRSRMITQGEVLHNCPKRHGKKGSKPIKCFAANNPLRLRRPFQRLPIRAAGTHPFSTLALL
jgi:hypothetical protein